MDVGAMEIYEMTCEWGDTVSMQVTIPAHLSYSGQVAQRIKGIDRCIADIVGALERAGIIMEGSCCGHGKGPGSILLADGRKLRILQSETE